jgi:DbpA RNA binding domain
VISYDLPDDPEEYTHRIGRTGRVDRTGIAITFASHKDAARVAEIERVTGAVIERLALADIGRKRPDAEPAVPAAAAPAEPAEPTPAAPIPQATNGHAVAAQVATRLFVGAGRRHGATRDDIAGLVTATGVEPLRIKVHHAFSFVDVPTEASERVIGALAEAELAGRRVNVERAERQPEPVAA